jgi:hypothetical protein
MKLYRLEKSSQKQTFHVKMRDNRISSDENVQLSLSEKIIISLDKTVNQQKTVQKRD